MGAGNTKNKPNIKLNIPGLNQIQQQPAPSGKSQTDNFFKSTKVKDPALQGQTASLQQSQEDNDEDVNQTHNLNGTGNNATQSREQVRTQTYRSKKSKKQQPDNEALLLENKLNKQGQYDKLINFQIDGLDKQLIELYQDIMEDPIMDDYLRVERFFQDEVDEEDQKLEYKYANEKVNPLRWDSQTVVHEIFRVIQDITQYNMGNTQKGEIVRLSELNPLHNSLGSNKPTSELLGNQIALKINVPVQFYNDKAGAIHDINNREGFTHERLYDQNLNKNLSDPPVIRAIGKSKLVLSVRVEFRKLLRTAICKVPVSEYVDGNVFLSQMQVWSTLPYHKRIIRPICFAQLNEKTPLVFIEDMAFVQNLEQVISNRSFYRGYQYRYEISHKILNCAIQIAEAMDHAHSNGILHLNLHVGNIMVARCSEKDEQYGFFVTDFGEPLMLQDETFWTENHEKIFSRMLKFQQLKIFINPLISPPHILSLIKSAASTKKIEDRREILRRIKQNQSVLVDVYCFGVILLFMLTGGYEWQSTIELQATFELKMQKAELIVDLQNLAIFKAILKRCFLIQKNDKPFEKISDILLNLHTARANVEKILRDNNVDFYSYENNSKPLYEYPAGKRKEELLIKDYQDYSFDDFSQQEQEIFQLNNKKQGGLIVGKEMRTKEYQGSDPDIILAQQEQKIKDNDENAMVKKLYQEDDVDLITLNNQAVLAYLKSNYQQCVDMISKIYDIVETNPISYFNYLLLCWEAGIYSDLMVFQEINRIAQLSRRKNFSSLMYALVYEAQNNWLPARVNYEIALANASDSSIIEIKRRVSRCREFHDKYAEQFLFGHLEMSDVQDLVVSFNGKLAVSFQKTSRIIVWNLQHQKILKEIEDKNATCMDANARLDRIVVGLRNGLIVMFNLAYEDNNFVANVEEIELGVRNIILKLQFHTSMILVIRISKDGYFGMSGGLDNYVALWNCQKKLLLSKIEIPNQYLKSACINMNGEELMFSTNSNFSVQVYHHYSNKKQVQLVFQLNVKIKLNDYQKHKCQVTSCEISYDGMLGITGGMDRIIFIWDLVTGDCIREIQVPSFIVKLSLTPMGKFLAANLLDGSILLYETLTAITWRTEKLYGKHSGISLVVSNFVFEAAKEGLEHKLINLLERQKTKLQDEYVEARGGNESSKVQSSKQNSKGTSKIQVTLKSRITSMQGSKQRSQQEMPTVQEVDPDQESDFKRTRQTQLEGGGGFLHQDQDFQIPEEDPNQHNLNQDEELMLQDLFFENAVFKYFYFQTEEFTKQLNAQDVYQELQALNFDRAKDKTQQNIYLLKSSLEQIKAYQNLGQQERSFQNFQILDDRRFKFDLNLYRQPKQELNLIKNYDTCRLLLLACETRAGDNYEINNHGQVVGLRVQQTNLPFIGMGPCQFITNMDLTKNIQIKIKSKAKQMREATINSYNQKSLEQAKYYLQRLREVQPLFMNPSVVNIWAEMQTGSYKKGKIHNIFKMAVLPLEKLHNDMIEHIKFTRNEKNLMIMSQDFKVSIWEVGSFKCLRFFRAYHDSHAQYYMRTIVEEQIIEEFDVSVLVLNDSMTQLVFGLYNGALQFWDLAQKDKESLILEIPSHLAEVTALVFNSNQTILVSAGADYLINVWSATTRNLLFEIREHLGAINYLSFVEDQDEEGNVEEQIVSIDVEGYLIYVSLEGYIEKKFSVERSSNHAVEGMDIVYSSYIIDRELFLVRRNLNTNFFEFQKIKAGVEPYYAAYDCNTFPTVIKNKVDKKKGIFLKSKFMQSAISSKQIREENSYVWQQRKIIRSALETAELQSKKKGQNQRNNCIQQHVDLWYHI
ncbi:wd40 repeat-containing protein [Stylonychia lemnae]|uniref:Wd40 repeat-containing protein n=1 Tax=Stylonychia lemnae TaxID=5949 RepID=A0A078A953_STYLE|nr:wd40 repeat-containing protein [Stylonychia lemnae]|eukprot:CDW78805.1 wd40 repeat-containing protein [Stylonychia lemnae]